LASKKVANDKKLTNRLEMKISFHHLFFRPRAVHNCFPKEDPNRINSKVFDFKSEQFKTSNAKFWTKYSILIFKKSVNATKIRTVKLT
jgi:hypothetical protein